MKKIFIPFFAFILFSTCLFMGCKKNEFSLANYLSELRENVYAGKSESYNVKAEYGFKKDNNEKIYQLDFMIKDIIDTNVNYTVCFQIGEKNYQKAFSFSPVRNCLYANVEIDCFTNDCLDITIKKANESESITLNSIVPKDTMNYITALGYLYSQQKTYIDTYIKDGVFCGKLIVRVVVKDNKGYYYIGLENESGKLKAMLIDGTNGELLAIRDVF